MRGIVITKSAKRHPSGEFGACILVYNEDLHKVLRLVQNDNGDSILEKNHKDIDLFDIIEFSVIKFSPIQNQIENVVIDLNVDIKKVCKCTIPPKELFDMIGTKRSRYIFGNKKCYLTDISKLNHSVEIIHVQDLTIYKNEIGKTKADFKYLNNKYNMYSVTDPKYYFYDSIDIESAYIIISMPYSDYNEKYYKFIAAVYELDE